MNEHVLYELQHFPAIHNIAYIHCIDASQNHLSQDSFEIERQPFGLFLVLQANRTLLSTT